MLPVINLGPLAIQTPGLILLIGVWLGLLRTERFARKLGVNPNLIYNLTLISFLVGILAARLSFAAQNSQAFSDNLLGLLALTPSMLDPIGGSAAGLLTAIIYLTRKKMPVWHTLDAFTPAAAIIMVILGISHLASGQAYGIPAELPWSISLWGANRHPSQIYETVSATIIAILIWPRKHLFASNIPGIRFLGFIALSAATRIFLETFRGDSQMVFSIVRVAQLVGWILLAATLWLIGWKFSSQSHRSNTITGNDS